MKRKEAETRSFRPFLYKPDSILFILFAVIGFCAF